MEVCYWLSSTLLIAAGLGVVQQPFGKLRSGSSGKTNQFYKVTEEVAELRVKSSSCLLFDASNRPALDMQG